MAKKKKPSKQPPSASIDPLKICACNNLRKASRAITQFFDDKLQAAALRSTQLIILLAIMQSEGGGGIAQIARTLGMDASTLNRNLRPLTDRRLVKITQGRSGHRKTIRLTAAGRKAIENATPIWESAQNQMVTHLGEDRYNGLLADLDLIVDATRDQ